MYSFLVGVAGESQVSVNLTSSGSFSLAMTVDVDVAFPFSSLLGVLYSVPQ